MRYAAALCALVFSASSTSAQKADGLHIANHRAAVATYIAAFPLALLADDVCPGIKADGTKLLVLRATANVADQEEVTAKIEMEKVEANARLAVARGGAAAWCRKVWALIGPRGSTVSGLLMRP